MTRVLEVGPDPTKRRWVVLGMALAIVALLVGGSLLVDAVLPGDHPMRAGEEVVLNEDAHQRISMTLDGDGWARDLDAEKVAGDAQVFVRDSLELQAVPVTLAGGGTADAHRLWEGMADTLRVKNPGARLAEPSSITSEQGVEGLTGALRGMRHESVAVLYPAPEGGSAVQMIFSAREASASLKEAVIADSASVVFGDKEAGA